MNIAIYGIYLAGWCVYVGCTNDPDARWLNHKTPGQKLSGLPDAKMRALRWASVQDGARIEAQVIRAFKRRGQAVLNSRTAPHYSPGYCISGFRHKETGIVYRTRSELARALGRGTSTISGVLRNGGQHSDFTLEVVS